MMLAPMTGAPYRPLAMQRLFVALRPPAPMRAQLLDLMGGVAGARWQDDAQLHLTLAFIGDADGALAESIDAALAGVDHAAIGLALSGVGHFGGDRPTALWAGAEPAAELAALAAKVDNGCRRAGASIRRRAFVPHITLARLPRSAGSIASFVAANATLSSAPMRVDGFALYESRLGSDGASYTPLAHYPLR